MTDMTDFAIYLYAGNGKLDFLAVIHAHDQADALAKAQSALPEKYHDKLAAFRWQGPERA